MAEQLPERDPLAARHEPGQMTRDGVVERQPPLVGELQHDRGDERLGDAAGAEAVTGPGAAGGDLAAVGAEGQRAGRAGGDDLPCAAVDLARVGGRRDEQREEQDEELPHGAPPECDVK